MIYFIRDPLARRVKIGFAKDPWNRLRNIQTGCSTDLELAGVMPGEAADERVLHRQFASYHVRGEWFAETGELAAYVASVPVPLREPRRVRRAPLTPFDGWMIENGMKDADIAIRFGFGRPFVSQMRHGARQPTLDVACALADLSGLHPRDFIVSTRDERRKARAA